MKLKLFTVLLLVFCLSGCNTKFKDGDFTFLKSSGAVYLIKYSGNDAIVSIPKEAKGNKIDYIDEGAFDNLTNLSEVHYLGENASIKKGAFKNLPNLKEVRFLNAKESVRISPGAFDNCKNLSSVISVSGIEFYLGRSFEESFVNCPSMAKPKVASSGSSSSNSTSSTKSGVVGTYRRVRAQATGGNTSSSSWTTVNEARLGSGINIPSQFTVNSNGTASAGSFNFSWSGSGSNITFTYSGSGNTRASYNASRGQIYLQFPAMYNGKVDLLAITYE